MLLFGGDYQYGEPRQISEVFSWKKSTTRRVRSLPFDFSGGKCIYNNRTVYLCFDMNKQKLCRYRYDAVFNRVRTSVQNLPPK